MNRTRLIWALVDERRISTEEAAEIVDLIFSLIQDSLAKGEDVHIRGFGTFTTRTRSASQGYNLATGQVELNKGTRRPHFKPGTELKRAVNGEDI